MTRLNINREDNAEKNGRLQYAMSITDLTADDYSVTIALPAGNSVIERELSAKNVKNGYAHQDAPVHEQLHNLPPLTGS